MCAVVVFGMLMGLSGTRVEEFKEGVVERALVFAVRFLHRLEERLGEVPVVATLHRAQVSPELFVAIEHVDVPVLIAGNDVGHSHGSINSEVRVGLQDSLRESLVIAFTNKSLVPKD